MAKRVPEHEKLVVHQRALGAAAGLEKFRRTLSPEWSEIRDQLRRASSSIVLNIAEGAGEFRPREKARFYRMARRSATECLAILDFTQVAGIENDAPEAKQQLREVIAMLTTVVVRLSERRPDPGP